MSIVVFYVNPNQIGQTFGGSLSTEGIIFSDDQLLLVLEKCRELRSQGMTHVCMASEREDQIGGNGVNSVEHGKLPDGSDYTWMKRRNQ
jgi:hypothetical protein